MDTNMLNLLGSLQGAEKGDASSLLSLLSLLNKKGGASSGDDASGAGGQKPDLGQLLALLKQMTPPEGASDEDEEEEPLSPCALCQEPCARAGLNLPSYEEARKMALLWCGYGKQF